MEVSCRVMQVFWVIVLQPWFDGQVYSVFVSFPDDGVWEEAG